ncbi:MAG TPA: TetR/AcrR family transcriptional regulator [Solirubrobacteraceae bacterium]|nr:TetR/AcrR family transcriptional regulator [Solirubrobacteraceae bacterium]
MEVTRRVPVQRRSRERVDTILQAATELLAHGGVEALTIRSLAAHTKIPVGSIYRYFDNRDAIIAAYLDRQLADIEQEMTTALLELELVSFRSLVETTALAHMRHHQAHPEGVPVWFGGRMNHAVLQRVQALDMRLAASLRAAVRGAGMLQGAPEFSAELIVRMSDRMFEFVFLAERTAAEQEAIVREFVEIVASYMERFVTPAGRRGISAQQLVRALAPAEP